MLVFPKDFFYASNKSGLPFTYFNRYENEEIVMKTVYSFHNIKHKIRNDQKGYQQSSIVVPSLGAR